jgi:hypothetical protein
LNVTYYRFRQALADGGFLPGLSIKAKDQFLRDFLSAVEGNNRPKAKRVLKAFCGGKKKQNQPRNFSAT